MGILEQFGALFLIVVAVSFVAKLLRQPIIVGYLAAGLIAAQLLSGLDELVLFLGEVGIVFLLFLMGMEFDLKSLRQVGKDVLLATATQSLALFGIGILLTLPFSIDWWTRVHAALLLMFSSTLLVAKWLEDRKETGTLHGRITLATLIIQDIIAILVITMLAVVREGSWVQLALAPLTGFGLAVFAAVIARYSLNPILRFASHYPELLFLTGIGVCFVFVWAARFVGYSESIGAFIGGVVIANTMFRTDLTSRIKPLIVFFNMLFFVGLGFRITDWPDPSIFLLLGLLVVASMTLKPIIIYATLRWRGYDQKTAFLSGLHLGQASEFGIILVAASIAQGVAGTTMMAMAILLVVATLLGSSYLIKYDRKLLEAALPRLTKYDRWRSTRGTETAQHHGEVDVIMFGYAGFGEELIAKLTALKKRILVVEQDMEMIERLRAGGVPCVYATAYTPELLEHLDIGKPQLILSSVNDLSDNLSIVKVMKTRDPGATAILTARNASQSLELYDAGADYVIYPAYLNRQHVTVLVQDYMTDINSVIAKKVEDIERLKREQGTRAGRRQGFIEIDTLIADLQHAAATSLQRADSIRRKLKKSRTRYS